MTHYTVASQALLIAGEKPGTADAYNIGSVHRVFAPLSEEQRRKLDGRPGGIGGSLIDDDFIAGAKGCLAAAIAASTVSAILNPFDVIKCRMQAQHQLQTTVDVPKRYYRNSLHCAARIAFEDGPIRGLWLPGLTASIARDIINGGLRVGMYPSVKTTLLTLYDPDQENKKNADRFIFKFGAGLVTGFGGSFLGNPFDLVKIRFQTESGRIGYRDQIPAQAKYDQPPTPDQGTGTNQIKGTINNQECSKGNLGPRSSQAPTSLASGAGPATSGAHQPPPSAASSYSLRYYSTSHNMATSTLYSSTTFGTATSSSNGATSVLLSSSGRPATVVSPAPAVLPASAEPMRLLVDNTQRRFFVDSYDFKRPPTEGPHRGPLVYTTGLYRGSEIKYHSTYEALMGLHKDKQLLRGVMPNIVRASLVTAGQVSSYDYSKSYLQDEYDMEQGTPMFVICGLISGFVSTVISAPVDVLKTRIMNDRYQMSMLGQKQEGFQYDSTMDCFRRSVGIEGWSTLYRGWFASYLRLGPHFVMGWPLLEYIRREVFGLSYF